MIININGGNGGGGGGSYTLPVASASVLGGVKIGSGITIDAGGAISAQGGGDDYTWVDLDDYYELTEREKAALYNDFVARVGSGDTKLGVIDEELRYVYNFYDVEANALYFHYVDASYDSVNHRDYLYAVVCSMTEDNIDIRENYFFNNYHIADALSGVSNPTEGVAAWVKPVAEEDTWNRVYISDYQSFIGENPYPENYLARVHWGDWDEQTMGDGQNLAFDIYQSGEGFHWGWENDGEIHTRDLERDGNYYRIEYRTHNNGYENSYFEWRPVDQTPWGDYIAGVSDYVTSTAVTETSYVGGGLYVYTQSAWIKDGNSVVFKWDEIEPSTSAETIALRTMFSDMVDRGFIPSILWDNHIFNYAGKNNQYVNFEAVHYYNSRKTLYISGSIVNEGGFDGNGIRIDETNFVDLPEQRTNYLTSAGTYDILEGGWFSEESNMDKIWFRMNSGEISWSQAPLKWVYRQIEQIDSEDKLVYYWCVEIPVNGVLYKGVWHANEGDWSNYTTDSWAAV